MKTRWLIVALAGLGVILLIAAQQLRHTAPPTPAAVAPASAPAGTRSPTPLQGLPHADPDSSSPASPATAPSAPTAAPSAEAPGEPAAGTGTDELEHADVSAAADPAVLALALEFAHRFARPAAGVTRAQWWGPVAELMTPQARADYAAVDPGTIPYTSVTGPATVLPSGADHSDLVTLVRVPTTAGTYVVHLRIDPARGWAVNQVTPPARATS